MDVGLKKYRPTLTDRLTEILTIIVSLFNLWHKVEMEQGIHILSLTDCVQCWSDLSSLGHLTPSEQESSLIINVL